MTSSPSPLAAILRAVVPLDPAIAIAAAEVQLELTKPPGSLGRIEALGNQLAAIAGSSRPPRAEPASLAVFAGDHGVVAQGVTPWPQEVTAQMVLNFCAGGAAINVIADSNHIDVTVVNAGIAHAVPDHPVLRNTPIGLGTGDIRIEPAMTIAQAEDAVVLGADVAGKLVAAGARCLLTGDMGIGNTTPSAALISSITGASPTSVTGRGTGIDDAMLTKKIEVISDAIIRAGVIDSPLERLTQLGGFEIAAIAGFCLGGAAAKVPVIIDGVIALAGAVVAAEFAPAVTHSLIAGHRSVEPAAVVALDHLGLESLIDLELRLGEGSGAALAYPLVKAAARIPNDMATFGDAGVSNKAT